ncbi:general substrate transporter [Microdochium bolleyi]|uniref:General substrate transporter n=1 Tax=Microdochium bolleyi TaxID=196109 RepID=A0A136IK90_9PEZI|nr:general substrate transporter [Microdochium bolleyi]
MSASIGTEVHAKSNAFHREHVHTIQVSAEADKSAWQLIKENPRVVLFAFLANCGSLLFGFDVLVQGAVNALPAFSMFYGSPFGDQLILPALWQGLWTATAALGIMVGAVVNGLLQDLAGRKWMFSAGGLVSCVGTGVVYVSADHSDVEARRGILLVGKFIIGVAMGVMMSTCQTYVSEISPPRLRTILLGFYPFFITVGQMIAITLVFSGVMNFTPYAFKLPFASQWAFGGWAVLVGVVIPESPVHLVAKGKLAAAEKAMRIIYGTGTSTAERIQSIESTIENERLSAAASNSTSYSECFRGTNLRRTRIVALLHSLQQFMGVSLVANSTYFFIMAGMNPTMSLTVNQIGVGLSMFFTLTSWAIMSRIGRRTAILGSLAFAGLVYLAMGIAGFFPGNQKAVLFIGSAVVIAASASNVGVGTAYTIVAAEIPSVKLRAKTTGLGFFVNAFMTWIFSFTVPYMFNADAGNLGGKIGFVFSGFCILGFALSWLEIPETLNVTYAHLDYLFQQNIPTRAFKTLDEDDRNWVAEH